MPLIRDDWLIFEAACLLLKPSVNKFHSASKWKYFQRQNRILKSGLLPDWVLASITKLSVEYDRRCSTDMKASEGFPITEHIPNEMRGNMFAYQLIHDTLYDFMYSRENNPPQEFVEATFLSSMLSAKSAHPDYSQASPLPSGETLVQVHKLLTMASDIQSCKTHLTRLFGAAERSAAATFGGSELMEGQIIRSMILEIEARTGLTYSTWLKRGNAPITSESVKSSLAPSYSTQWGLTATKFGKIFFIKYKERDYYLSSTHVDHLIHFLRGVSNLILSEKILPTRSGMVSLLYSIFDHLINDACYYTSIDKAGYYTKGAKALAISRVAEENFHIGDPERNLLSAFDKDRINSSKRLVAICMHSLGTLPLAISFLDIYKLFPHPDCNLSACFESIDGLKNPNRVDGDMRKEIKGIMIRNAYLSMKKMKMDVRGFCYQEEKEDVDIGLQDALNATNVNVTVLANYPPNSWASVKFLRVKKVPMMEELHVKIGDKASQEGWLGDLNDLKELGKHKAGFEEKEQKLIEVLKSSNDIVSKITKSYHWNLEKSLRRFENVVMLHEEFEKSQKALGIEIDEISHEDLAQFLFMNPKASYICGTEPKYGEVHKFITRMFYMAERDLKVLTQRVERIVRRVSGRQSGVSITKSYRARMKDMEQFASAMVNTASNHKIIYISFDMSEFSKKFPMAIVRDYGEMLSQITGDAYLRRIDLVFRACIVIHNTRGFFGYKAGCKGGFEGFLNFAWSSIHASVMEAAINTTGVSGVFLTFSDDGVAMLRFKPDVTQHEVDGVVKAIQRVYQRSGLSFHIGKTIVSDAIWEYLGDVYYRGHLLPSYFKELASIGKYEPTKSISSRTDNHKVMVAQVAQLVEKGYPGDLGRLLGFLHTIQHIKSINKNMNVFESLALCILPYKVGGYRVPSDIELRCRVDFERDEELIADLSILHRFRHPVYSLAATALSKLKATKQQLTRMYVTGASFPRSENHIDPEDLYRKAIDAGIDELGLSKTLRDNPISDEFLHDLLEDLSGSEDVDLVPLFAVFRKSSVYMDYTSSLAMVKSASFLKLVGRGTVKSLQAWDNRRVMKSMVAMKDIFSESYYQEPDTFIHKYKEAVQAMYSIIPPLPIMSVREFLHSGGDSIVLVASTDSDTIQKSETCPYDHREVINWEYTDPPKGDAPMYTSLSWSAEDTGSSELFADRKTIEAGLAYIATYPAMETVTRKYLDRLGCSMPSVLRDLLSSVKRRQVIKGSMYDSNIRYAAPYNRCTSVSYNPDFWSAIAGMDRCDRNRITRVVQYCCSEISQGLSNRRKSLGIMRWELMGSMDLLQSTMSPLPNPKIAKVISHKPLKTGSKDLTDEIKATIEEIEDDFKVREQLLMSSSMPEDPELASIIGMLFTRQLENALYRSLQTPVRPNSGLLPFPSSLGPDILRDAILFASLRLLPPQEQGLVKRLSCDSKFGSQVDISDYDVIRKMSLLFAENIDRVKESYPSLTLWDLISKDSTLTKEDCWSIADRVLADSVTIHSRDSRLVISDDSNIMTEAVTGVKDLYREAISSTITVMLSHGRAVKYEETKLGEIIGGSHKGTKTITYDNILDALYIIRSILRESSHRSKPYNETTLKIESLKFYTALFALSEDFALAKEGIEADLVKIDDRGAARFTDDCMDKICSSGYLEKRNRKAYMVLRSTLLMRREASGSSERSSDHLDLLNKGLKQELKKRIKDHMSHMIKTGGEPYSLVDDRLGYVENLGTSVYHMILYKVATSIKVVRKDTASEVYRVLGANATNQVDSLVYKAFSNGICPDKLPLESLSTSEVRIVASHLFNCASSNGFFCADTANDGSNGDVINQCIAAGGLVRPNDREAVGITAAYISENFEGKEESDLYIISVSTQYRLAALDTYFTVLNNWGSSASIHYDKSTHNYTILGCMSRRPTVRLSTRLDYSRLSVHMSMDPHYSTIWSVSDEELMAAFKETDPRKAVYWKTDIPKLSPTTEELAAFFDKDILLDELDEGVWENNYDDDIKAMCAAEEIDYPTACELIREHYHAERPMNAVTQGLIEIGLSKGKSVHLNPRCITAKEAGRLERITNYLNEVERRICTFGESLSMVSVKRGITTGQWDLSIGKASFTSPVQMVDAFYSSIGKVGVPMPGEFGLIAAGRLSQATPTPRATATIAASVLEWIIREGKEDPDIGKIEQMRNSIERIIRTKNPQSLKGEAAVSYATRLKNINACRHWVMGTNPLPGPEDNYTEIDKFYRLGLSDSTERMQSTLLVLGRPFQPAEVFRSKDHKLSSNLDVILFRPIEQARIAYESSSSDDEDDGHDGGYADDFM